MNSYEFSREIPSSDTRTGSCQKNLTRKMKNCNYFQFFFCLVLVSPSVLCIKLTDVTVDLFHAQAGGIVAAFGDFNADKLTDIFVLNDAGMYGYRVKAPVLGRKLGFYFSF